ncbi:DUF7695 domain-containing protein [Caldimonas sp. KR1-144]|uniref:DUF7695 domain-containing protein n=1 Tax=Caldimonas sp. KR1-144 TaxID=3400911 RepID=UPI003C07EB62
MNAPEPPQHASWQRPVRCTQCDDVIWSRYRGEFRSCKCGAISVDQTPHYSRYVGNPADFLPLGDEGVQ